MPRLFRILEALFTNRIRLVEKYGRRIDRIGRIDFGRIRVVIVKEPELVPEVLIERADDFVKGPMLRVVARPVLGDGLLTSEGELHRQRRKLVAPAFAHQRVSRYADVMREQAAAMAQTWREGQEIDIGQAMMRLTLGIVGRTLFDVDLLDQADSLGADITFVQNFAIRQIRTPFPLPFQGRARAALARLNETIYSMIRGRRASGEDKGDLLSMLLLSRDEETGEFLNDDAVRDEAMTLFLAGHETTAQAMAWSWYLLGSNPQYFARLREESEPFALRVMKESMRLYPPAPALARSAVRDTVIGGFPVTKGEIVFLSPWLLHRDPRLFQDPLHFEPDRFLPEREARITRFAYLPFGGGRRICIGNQFALMEGQIILAEMARHAEFTLISKRHPGYQPLLTLRPKRAINVRIHKLSATDRIASTTASGSSS